MRQQLTDLRAAIEGGTSGTRGSDPIEYIKVLEQVIYLRNGRLWVSMPCEEPLTFCAHADTLYKALDKIPEAEISNATERRITLSYPRGKAHVRALPRDQWERVAWRDPAPLTTFDGRGLLEALRILQPFISDNAFHSWSLGVQCNSGHLLATDNIVLAVVKRDVFPWNLVIPRWLIDFMLEHEEPPDKIGFDQSVLSMGWRTGLVVTAMVPAEQFPEQAVQIATQPCSEDAWTIPLVWRQAIERLEGLSQPTSVVQIDPQVLTVDTGDTLVVEEHVDTPVTDTRRFRVSSLYKVIQIASRIEIDGGVVKWRCGADTFGVIAGRV